MKESESERKSDSQRIRVREGVRESEKESESQRVSQREWSQKISIEEGQSSCG